MKRSDSNSVPGWIRRPLLAVVAATCLGVWTACSVPKPIEATVEKTAKTIKRTTRSITRTITLDDRDLLRTVDIFNFENNSPA